jgi:hypothetical protein
VELVAPIPGRELEKDPVALTLDDFAMDERYARRSGIESTNSGLKNRLELKRLRVRGRGSVTMFSHVGFCRIRQITI